MNWADNSLPGLIAIYKGKNSADPIANEIALSISHRSPRCAALVYEWGHSSLKWKTADGKFQSTSGHFLTVWKQTSDAHWEIIRNLTL